MAEHLHGILAILELNCFRGETRKEGEERVVGGGEARLKVRPVVPIATAAIRAVHNLLYQPKWKRCWCVSHDGGRKKKYISAFLGILPTHIYEGIVARAVCASRSHVVSIWRGVVRKR